MPFDVAGPTLSDAMDRLRATLEVQRDVVKNERRQRYENSPYGASELAMSRK